MPIEERHSRTWTGRRRRGTASLCFLLSLLLLLLVVVAFALHPSAIYQTDRQLFGDEPETKRPPLCVGNLLDRREYDRIVSGDVTLPLANRGGNGGDGTRCRLKSYTAEPIAACLDALFHRAAAANGSQTELIFVFMGDSRIRQQFFNFVKIIPNYDRVTVPSPLPAKYHGDIEMTSRVLRLRVSFKWRPLVDDKLVDTLRRTRESAASDPRKRPQFILLSMAAWHMLREHGADLALYRRRLTQLGPLLASMSPSCGRIIWLRQYTSMDSYGDNDKSNTLVVSGKIRQYNEAAAQRLVFRSGESSSAGVDLWDSSDAFASEYVRACALLKRYERSSYASKEYATAYANCHDYVHTGYSALSLATQLLYNDLCNAHVYNNGGVDIYE